MALFRSDSASSWERMNRIVTLGGEGAESAIAPPAAQTLGVERSREMADGRRERSRTPRLVTPANTGPMPAVVWATTRHIDRPFLAWAWLEVGRIVGRAIAGRLAGDPRPAKPTDTWRRWVKVDGGRSPFESINHGPRAGAGAALKCSGDTFSDGSDVFCGETLEEYPT